MFKFSDNLCIWQPKYWYVNLNFILKDDELKITPIKQESVHSEENQSVLFPSTPKRTISKGEGIESGLAISVNDNDGSTTTTNLGLDDDNYDKDTDKDTDDDDGYDDYLIPPTPEVNGSVN